MLLFSLTGSKCIICYQNVAIVNKILWWTWIYPLCGGLRQSGGNISRAERLNTTDFSLQGSWSLPQWWKLFRAKSRSDYQIITLWVHFKKNLAKNSQLGPDLFMFCPGWNKTTSYCTMYTRVVKSWTQAITSYIKLFAAYGIRGRRLTVPDSHLQIECCKHTYHKPRPVVKSSNNNPIYHYRYND